MSDPVAKAERSRAKDARQGKIDDERVRKGKKRKKKDRPWQVYTDWLFCRELCVHRAETREQAEAWIEKELRSYLASVKPRHYWIKHKYGEEVE